MATEYPVAYYFTTNKGIVWAWNHREKRDIPLNKALTSLIWACTMALPVPLNYLKAVLPNWPIERLVKFAIFEGFIDSTDSNV